MPTSSLAPSYSPSATRLILKAICITFHPWLKWLLVFYRISPKLLSLRVEAEVRTQASRPISAYTYVPPPHTYTDTHTHTPAPSSMHFTYAPISHADCLHDASLWAWASALCVCAHTHACTHTCVRTHMHLLLQLYPSSMYPSAMQTVCMMPASGPGHQLCARVHTHIHVCAHTHTCSFICALHLCTHQPCRLSARCQPLGLGISSVRVCTHTCMHTHMRAHTHAPAPSAVPIIYVPISHADCLHDASLWAWASALL